jgi:hypothetical protein
MAFPVTDHDGVTITYLCLLDLDAAARYRRLGSSVAAAMSLLVADALASQDKQARWVLTQELLPAIVELDCVDAQTLELLAGPFEAQVSFEERRNLLHEVPRSRIASFNALVTAMEALDTGDPAQVALGNLGATLYAHDDGASDPASLARLQSALRAQLDLADDHAR